MSKRASALAGFACLLLLAGPARGAVIEALSLEKHLDESVTVVRGRVMSIAHTLEGNMPYTITSVKVLESYKGSRTPDEIVRIRQLGGPAGDGVLVVPGDATFELGEEVIVFLHEDGPEGSYLTALSFSKYTVDRSAGGALVVRDVTGLSFHLPQGQILGDIGDTPVALPYFRDALRALQD